MAVPSPYSVQIRTLALPLRQTTDALRSAGAPQHNQPGSADSLPGPGEVIPGGECDCVRLGLLIGPQCGKFVRRPCQPRSGSEAGIFPSPHHEGVTEGVYHLSFVLLCPCAIFCQLSSPPLKKKRESQNQCPAIIIVKVLNRSLKVRDSPSFPPPIPLDRATLLSYRVALLRRSGLITLSNYPLTSYITYAGLYCTPE